MNCADLAIRGKKLRETVDGKIEALQETGCTPAYILLDMNNYQLWCMVQAARRAEDVVTQGDYESVIEHEETYRGISIVAIPQLETLVFVAVAMGDVRDSVAAFMRVASV